MANSERGLIAAAVAAHVPSLGSDATIPDFQQGLVRGLREMGAAIRAMAPDVLVGAMQALSAGAGRLSGRQFGDYAQSSGSGNVNVLVTAA